MTKKYVDNGIGLPVFRGPYLQQDANLAAFLFRADYERLTLLCYKHLVDPSDKETVYIPLLPNVMVLFADMLVSSLDNREKNIGRIPETEISFWVLTVAMRKAAGVLVPHHLAWFLPALFVDESNSITTGREVYGFNKLFANIQKPQHIQKPKFSADVLGFEKFDPSAVAKSEPLLRLSPVDKTEPAETARDWENWEQASTEIDKELLKNIKPDQKNLLVNFGSRLVNAAVPLVFLRQLRDTANTSEAGYQEILEAPITIKKFHAGGFLPGKYQLEVKQLASHPLAEQLGLKLTNGSQKSLAALWMKVDFVLGAGKTIWRAM